MAPGKKFDGQRRTALDMLTRSHQRLVGVMAELRRALRAGDEDVIAESLAYLRGPARRHELDEELSVFPRLGDSERSLIEQLVGEHRDHERATDELARACRRGDRELALRLADELAARVLRHSKLEEQRLWPAIASLDPESLEGARREMRARRAGGGRGRR